MLSQIHCLIGSLATCLNILILVFNFKMPKLLYHVNQVHKNIANVEAFFNEFWYMYFFFKLFNKINCFQVWIFGSHWTKLAIVKKSHWNFLTSVQWVLYYFFFVIQWVLYYITQNHQKDNKFSNNNEWNSTAKKADFSCTFYWWHWYIEFPIKSKTFTIIFMVFWIYI